MPRNRFRAWDDPIFHLLALITILLAVTHILDLRVPGSVAKVEHPANCHACSRCSSGAGAARDHFLLQTGAIDDVDCTN
jgi:hypothetical protein